MPSDLPSPGSPAAWLRYAKSDLRLARIDKPEGVLLENLCFHAQQAVGKSLKAALIFLEIDFPKTHNIRMLLDLLPSEIDIPDDVQESAILTEYAVESRYPGNTEPIDYAEYSYATDIAGKVVQWAHSLIEDASR